MQKLTRVSFRMKVTVHFTSLTRFTLRHAFLLRNIQGKRYSYITYIDITYIDQRQHCTEIFKTSNRMYILLSFFLSTCFISV